jgi:hypothetical protein
VTGEFGTGHDDGLVLGFGNIMARVPLSLPSFLGGRGVCPSIRPSVRVRREFLLGNTILVKLELWESVIVFNNNFYSATNLCLRYASAKCGR